MTLAVLAALAVSTLSLQDDACTPAEHIIGESRAHMEAGEFREADRDAERAINAAPGCIAAQLLLVDAIGNRLAGSPGLAALGLSRRFRRAVATALELEPDNIEARESEIGYLIHAPGIAGGDRRRAAERIESLAALDPVTAGEMRVELARANGDAEPLIEALGTLSTLTPGDFRLRSEFARRLIVAGDYDRAEAELAAWPDGDPWREAERGYLRGALRVLGDFDLETAETMLEQARSIEPVEDGDGSWPPRSGMLALIGAAREGLGNLTGAREAFESALSEDSENARARAGLERLDSR